MEEGQVSALPPSVQATVPREAGLYRRKVSPVARVASLTHASYYAAEEPPSSSHATAALEAGSHAYMSLFHGIGEGTNRVA